MVCTEPAVYQGFIQEAEQVMSRTACPSFLLLLVREEKMLGTCAHLWDPTSPISIAGTTPGQLAIEEHGSGLRGLGKVVLLLHGKVSV